MNPIITAGIALAGAAAGSFMGGSSEKNTQAEVLQDPKIQQSPRITQAPQVKVEGSDSQAHVTADIKPVFNITINTIPGSDNKVAPEVNVVQPSTTEQKHAHVTKTEETISSGDTNPRPKLGTSPTTPANNPYTQSAGYMYYTSWFREPTNLRKIAVGAGVAGIFGVIYFVRSSEQKSQHKSQWCNWKEEIVTNNLAFTENIATELIKDIQQRYATINNAHDFVEPLQIFLKDIEQEKESLSRYVNFCSFMHAIIIGRLFGINDCALEKAKDRLQRVETIKKIFVSWTVEYKLGKRAR